MGELLLEAEKRHKEWIQHHLMLRKGKGEHHQRLLEGHSYAEQLFATQIWFPVVGHFENLYPEYPLNDYSGHQRYLDFAYIRPPFQICIEIDGFGAHARDASRWSFADGLMRQNQLTLDNWFIFRFSVDDVKHNPKKCQQIVMQMMGKWFGIRSAGELLTLREKQILQHIIQTGVPITAKMVSEQLRLNQSHVRKILKQICSKGYLTPAGNADVKRVRAYEVVMSRGLFML